MAYTPISLGAVDNDDTGDSPKPAGIKINDNFASMDAQFATINSKLTGIAVGATANQTDAYLLSRVNHTGTQLSTTISDFTEASQDVTGAMIAAAGGTYNDAGNSITLPFAPVASPSFTGVVTVASSALTISAGSVAWDAAAGGNVRTLAMTANATLANPTNMVAGRHYTVLVTQDATGSRTLAYGTAYIFPGGTKPVLSTAANAKDMLVFYCDGTNMWGIDNKAFS